VVFQNPFIGGRRGGGLDLRCEILLQLLEAVAVAL
jgi:hypothetical protein